MELFCEFSVHEYMDMYPRTTVRTFVADDLEGIQNAAKEYARYMNTNYSGGSTTFIKVMSKEEARKYIEKQCAIVDPKLEDPEEFSDRVWKIFHDCYGD